MHALYNARRLSRAVPTIRARIRARNTAHAHIKLAENNDDLHTDDVCLRSAFRANGRSERKQQSESANIHLLRLRCGFPGFVVDFSVMRPSHISNFRGGFPHRSICPIMCSNLMLAIERVPDLSLLDNFTFKGPHHIQKFPTQVSE